MKKNLVLTLLFILLVTTGQSCQFGIQTDKNKDVIPDAGVWKTTDGGATWLQVKNIPTASGKPGSIGAVNVLTMEVDPQDNNAIYLGTMANGIFFTYDGGATWQQRNSFSTGKVYSVKVSPDSKCIIYATLNNTVQKTTDCGRTWNTMFIDNDAGTEIKALAIDHYNSNVIYAGTSKGILHKSFDYGATWSTPFNKISGNIVKFLVDPKDSRIIYMPTVGNGIYKSINAGVDWLSLNENLKEFKGHNEYRSLIFNPAKENSLFLASKYGLLKTEDGGTVWTPIPVLTDPGRADIRVVNVNPKDDRIIYYTTRNIFYKTVNGGSDWETKKLFTTKAPNEFNIDMTNPNIMYMGLAYP